MVGWRVVVCGGAGEGGRGGTGSGGRGPGPGALGRPWPPQPTPPSQIPLIHLSRRFRGRRRGNMIVWLSLFMGQPLLEILYFREWFATHDSFFCV